MTVHPDPTSEAPPEYRDELFGAMECEEAPFWLSLDTPSGAQRTEAEALKVINDFWGEPTEEPWVVSRVWAYVGRNEYGDITLHEKPEGMSWGPFEFWKVDE